MPQATMYLDHLARAHQDGPAFQSVREAREAARLAGLGGGR
jgi:hypothetical protein